MRKIFSLILFFAFMACCTWAKETTIVIYSTNDTHGSIKNFAKIAKFIQAERTKYPHVIVMNGGDIFSGNPIVDQHEQRGLPMIELMNKVGYDYATFGNRAPLLRNLEIIDYSDLVLAFWDGQSRGTKFVIENCRKKGKPCKIFLKK